jgi:hypothetical protein
MRSKNIGGGSAGDEEQAHEKHAGKEDGGEAAGRFILADHGGLQVDEGRVWRRYEVGAAQIESGVDGDGQSLLNHLRQDTFRGVGEQLKLNGQVQQEGHLQAFGEEQEGGGIAAIDACAAGIASYFLDPDHLTQRLAVEGFEHAGAGDGVVFIGDQQKAPRGGRFAAEDQAHQNGEHQRDTERDQELEGIAARAGPVFAQADGEEVHGYSRSSFPVSLMKRLSRLGWVKVAPRTSAPAAASAEKIAGRRREASGSARISRFSSACRISAPSMG